jgi:hypothetical protein
MNKKGIVYAVVLLFLVVAVIIQYFPVFRSSDDTTRVLFIGSSLTFYNDMPDMFAELAVSGGHTVEVDMSAYGGWTLSDHAASDNTSSKLEQHWDYVILQEQSVIPSITDERTEKMYPAVRLLYSKVSGGALILFMTWGRRDGLFDAGFSNFSDMQAQIQAGYTEIGNELGVVVAPVGVAWQDVIQQNPQVTLWHTDGVHPSKEGSYLAACVFYAVIFQQSPEGLAYTAGLPEEITQVLQAIASEIVLGDQV